MPGIILGKVEGPTEQAAKAASLAATSAIPTAAVPSAGGRPAKQIDPRLQNVAVRPDAAFQKKNASLGIALAETALRKLDPSFKSDPEKLSKEFVDGLEQVVWRGRCEVKAEGSLVWHVDGAHTVDSLKMATTTKDASFPRDNNHLRIDVIPLPVTLILIL